MVPVPQANVNQEPTQELEPAVVDAANSVGDGDELMFLYSELVDEVDTSDHHRGSGVSNGLHIGWLMLGRLWNLQLLVAVT